MTADIRQTDPGLRPRHVMILDAIRGHVDEYGQGPTFAELRARLTPPSRASNMSTDLAVLEARGHIRRPGSGYHIIRLVADIPDPSGCPRCGCTCKASGGGRS